MGADESDRTDMLNTFLDTVALRGTAVDNGTLALLDRAIDNIWRYLLWYKHTWSHTRADHVAVLRALCHMLAKREKYLLQHVYKDMYDKKKAAIKNVRVMIHTHSFVLKYTAELCTLPKGFDTDDGPIRCLLVDEVHQHDFMQLLACLPGVQWCGLLGDEMQQKGKGHQRQTSAGEIPVPHRQRDTQEIAALDWLKSSDIWTFNLQQTYRLGETVVSLLKQAFRNQLPDLVSIRSTDTLVLLTLFVDTESNFDDHSGEVTSSYGFFASVLLQLTFEIVFFFLHKGYRSTPRDNIPILIIGYLLGPLAFLKAFLTRTYKRHARVFIMLFNYQRRHRALRSTTTGLYARQAYCSWLELKSLVA
jgi:hypothetical protein